MCDWSCMHLSNYNCMKGSSDLSCCMFGIREMFILGNWHRLIGKVIYVIKGQIEEG